MNTSHQSKKSTNDKSTTLWKAVALVFFLILIFSHTSYFDSLKTKFGRNKYTITSVRDILSRISYVDTIFDLKKIESKKVYILSGPGPSDGLDFYLTDFGNTDMHTWKKVHHLDLGSQQYGAVISPAGSYFLLTYAGADRSDFVIFDIHGDVVATGVQPINEELKNWSISYDSSVRDNIIKISLYKIDGTRGIAEIDLSTGKMIPDSLKIVE